MFLSEIRIFGTLPETEEPGESGVTAEFYVDPDNGDDGNDGSINLPFATIQKARDVIRTINSDMAGNIVVNLRGGEYDIDSTIEFDTRDSGSNGYTITYRTTETASDGTYTVASAQISGKYIVKAEKASYNTASKTVYVPFASVTDANILLDRKGNGNNDGSSTPPPVQPGKVNIGPIVTDQGTATVNIDTAALAKALTKSTTAFIEIPRVEGTTTYVVTLPPNTLASGNANHSIKVATEFGSILAAANMLRRSDIAGAKNISISIGRADTGKLDADLQAKIGNRPVNDLLSMHV